MEFSSNRGHLLAKTGGEPFLLNRAHADILKLVCRWCIGGTASYSRCGLAQTKKRLEDTATGLFCNISLNQMPGRMVSALPHVDLHTTACHLKLKPKDFQITSKHWARNPSYIWHYSTSLCETHGSSFRWLNPRWRPRTHLRTEACGRWGRKPPSYELWRSWVHDSLMIAILG